MEKAPARYKAKNKKAAPNAKPKTAKKRKCDGASCSMFLAELTKKLSSKKKQEDDAPKNIVQTIIDSITNALPIKFSKKSPPKSASPMKIETLQSLAPELLPNDTLNIPQVVPQDHEGDNENVPIDEVEIAPKKYGAFKMPKMPLVSSEVLKQAVERERKRREQMKDQAVNTGPDHDVASEIARHVNTLKKISLIAEEFNQKTAKNLKEIVDSVQEDLIKKLEEIETEKALAEKAAEIQKETQNMQQGVCTALKENIE